MTNKNKKILGATTLYYNNIKFRSKLECSCYKKLESSGLNFAYESQKFVLWEGTKPNNITIYAPNKIGVGKYSKLLECNYSLFFTNEMISIIKRLINNCSYGYLFLINKNIK